RNFQHLQKGLDEIKRVLKPGGKLVILEFSRPSLPVIKQFYNFYMITICPTFGKLFSKNKDAYKYLDASIKKFPEGNSFLNILNNVGFKNSLSKKLTLGICSIYSAEK
ncbi:MAG: class I SAM-dependent methyltransferase, partial [Ferruginibacter sp.]